MILRPHRYASVVLGFAEEAPPSAYHPFLFPSKAGGLPVWLYLHPTAAPPAPRCRICTRPHRFLLQIYAPLESDVVSHDDSFHRILYVSVCPSATCQQRPECAAVLRAQLPRRNAHYPYDAVLDHPPDVHTPDVCAMCGFAAAKRCAKCHGVSYCGRACQTEDWKLGHREQCGDAAVDVQQMEERRARERFKEVNIVTEAHPTPDSSDGEEDSEGDEEEGEVKDSAEEDDGKRDSPAATASPAPPVDLPVRGTLQDADADELPEELFRQRPGGGWSAMASGRFHRAVSAAPEQVVRYEWGGEPVWASAHGQSPDMGGSCARCGAPRVFELQVMPQLAWYVGHAQADGSLRAVAHALRHGMDWGTLVVYSCSRSCPDDAGAAYVAEHAWAQPLPGATGA